MEENLYTQAVAARDWEQARQAARLEGMLGIFRTQSHDLLSFDEVYKQLRLSHRCYCGLKDIPVDQIRGSVGRYQDFTGTFLPKTESMRERWIKVNVVATAQGLPPIEVFKVGEAYFVHDGNHRVSIARQNKYPTIQAHVWEYSTPTGLSSQADINEVLLKAEYAEFLRHTDLDRLRPDQHIEFTIAGRYLELEYQIALYHQIIEQIDQETCTYEYAVTAWYDLLYTTAIKVIQESRLLDQFPQRTEADLFIWVWRHRNDLKAQGESPPLGDVIDDLTTRQQFPLKRWWQGLAAHFKVNRMG